MTVDPEEAIAELRQAVMNTQDEHTFINGPATIVMVETFWNDLLRWRCPRSYLAILWRHDGAELKGNTVYQSFMDSVQCLLMKGDPWLKHRQRWPVAGDDCGNFWLLAIEQQQPDGECPVVFFDHEIEAETPAADSFAEFVLNRVRKIAGDR